MAFFGHFQAVLGALGGWIQADPTFSMHIPSIQRGLYQKKQKKINLTTLFGSVAHSAKESQNHQKIANEAFLISCCGFVWRILANLSTLPDPK